MASKRTLRKFHQSREAHYALEREKDVERAQARLKGFRVHSSADLTEAVLGVRPGKTKHEVLAEGLASDMNRAERRARGGVR